MRLRIVTALLAHALAVTCFVVSCRSETSGAPDAGEPRPDPKAACATLASKVRDTYGALRNHYDRERWEKLVGRFDGARAETLRGLGQSLADAERAGDGIVLARAARLRQGWNPSEAERKEWNKRTDELVVEARKKAQDGLKQTDAKAAAFVAELEGSSDPSCASALLR